MNLRAEKKARQKESILDTCQQLFRQRGFDETTVSHITAECGISRQTFFNYFSGKDAVLTELGLRWLQQQSTVPRLEGDSPKQGSFLAGTRAAIRAQLQAIEKDVEFMRLVFTRSGLLFPQANNENSKDQRKTDYSHALFAGIAQVMAAAQAAGEVRDDIEPLQIAELYVSQMLMTVRLWLIDYWQDGVSLETRAMKALDVIERGLKK